MVLPAQKAKASPRGRASYRRAEAPPALLLWEPRPRGESDGSVSSKSNSFAPRSGLLQKSQSAARAASVGAAPRGECDGSACSKAKASPRGRGSYRRAKAPPAASFLWESRPAANAEVLPAQKAKASPRGRASYRRAKAPPAPSFLWEARPAANAEVLPAQKPSFAPRSGLLQKSQSAARAVFCGRRAPRRMLRSVSSKAKASPRGRASYRRTKSAARVALWEPRPRGECGGSACPKAKSFAPRSGLLHPHGECRRCQLNGNSSARGSAPHRMP